MSSVMQLGAKPCRALYVISRILKLILYLIGSQCNSKRIGIMWSKREIVHMILAAAFCTP